MHAGSPGTLTAEQGTWKCALGCWKGALLQSPWLPCHCRQAEQRSARQRRQRASQDLGGSEGQKLQETNWQLTKYSRLGNHLWSILQTHGTVAYRNRGKAKSLFGLRKSLVQVFKVTAGMRETYYGMLRGTTKGREWEGLNLTRETHRPQEPT